MAVYLVLFQCASLPKKSFCRSLFPIVVVAFIDIIADIVKKANKSRKLQKEKLSRERCGENAQIKRNISHFTQVSPSKWSENWRIGLKVEWCEVSALCWFVHGVEPTAEAEGLFSARKYAICLLNSSAFYALPSLTVFWKLRIFECIMFIGILLLKIDGQDLEGI